MGVKEPGPFGWIKKISRTKTKVVLGCLIVSQEVKLGEKEKMYVSFYLYRALGLE